MSALRSSTCVFNCIKAEGHGRRRIARHSNDLLGFYYRSRSSTVVRKGSTSNSITAKLVTVQRHQVQLLKSSRYLSDSTKSAEPYGLKLPDYSKPPPKWPLPPHPPANTTQTMFTIIPIVVFFVGGIYIYFNQDEDMYGYWQQVEQGNVPLDDDDDDDDDEEDEGEE